MFPGLRLAHAVSAFRGANTAIKRATPTILVFVTYPITASRTAFPTAGNAKTYTGFIPLRNATKRISSAHATQTLAPVAPGRIHRFTSASRTALPAILGTIRAVLGKHGPAKPVPAIYGTHTTVLGAIRTVLPLVFPAPSVTTVRRTFPAILGAGMTALVLSAYPVAAAHGADPAILRASDAILLGRHTEPVPALDRTLPAILGAVETILLGRHTQAVPTLDRTFPTILAAIQTILRWFANPVATQTAHVFITNTAWIPRAKLCFFRGRTAP